MTDIIERINNREAWAVDGLLDDSKHEIESLRQQLGECTLGFDTGTKIIEELRQRVKDLYEDFECVTEKLSKECAASLSLMEELAALKQSQGEPFGWYWETDYEDGIIVNDQSGNYDIQPNWKPLYTSAPTIPEGWQLVRTEDVQFCIDAIQDWGAYASEYFQDKWGLDKDIERAKAMLTAAPKPENR